MQFLKNLFNKPDSGTGTVEKDPERLARELLRENLNTVTVDMFDVGDPMLKMTPDERSLYLKHFSVLAEDKYLGDLFRMLINQQVARTMSQGARLSDPKFDFAGAMKIDGIALVQNAIDQRAAMHKKEQPVFEEFNRYSVFPDLK